MPIASGPRRTSRARLLSSLRAASFNQAMQGRNERLGYGDYVPVGGTTDHFYSEAERVEQEAYLRVRPPLADEKKVDPGSSPG